MVGIAEDKTAMLRSALKDAGLPRVALITSFNVTELGRLQPEVVVCDLDAAEGDPLENVRQLRFVLPDSTIAIFTDRMYEHWAAVCHLAGANCLLAKNSTETEISDGIRYALRSGCFTDRHFTMVIK